MADCAVCTEPIVGKAVTCAACDYAACRPCARRYVLMQADPSCMNCRAVWDRDVLVSHFGASFVNVEYKKHRETVLLDRERSMLPATQERLALYREARELKDGLPAKRQRMRDLRREIEALKNEIDADDLRASMLRNHNYAPPPPGQQQAAADTPRTVAKVLRACPRDGCRGFVYDDYKCGACAGEMCRKCHEPLVEKHACAPENIASARAILRDSKPCPSCAAVTYRISGCYQMWCVSCHTAWDWNTGKVDTGSVHNPEYFRWLARTGGGGGGGAGGGGGGGGGGVGEGGCRTIEQIVRQLRRDNVEAETVKRVMEAHQQSVHVQRVTIPNLRTENDNVLLRLRYLDGELTDTQFKSKLQRADKKRSKAESTRAVLEMFVAATRDVLQPVRDSRTAQRALGQIDELRKYVEESFKEIGKRYNSSAPCLPPVRF